MLVAVVGIILIIALSIAFVIHKDRRRRGKRGIPILENIFDLVDFNIHIVDECDDTSIISKRGKKSVDTSTTTKTENEAGKITEPKKTPSKEPTPAPTPAPAATTSKPKKKKKRSREKDSTSATSKTSKKKSSNKRQKKRSKTSKKKNKRRKSKPSRSELDSADLIEDNTQMSEQISDEKSDSGISDQTDQATKSSKDLKNPSSLKDIDYDDDPSSFFCQQ